MLSIALPLSSSRAWAGSTGRMIRVTSAARFVIINKHWAAWPPFFPLVNRLLAARGAELLSQTNQCNGTHITGPIHFLCKIQVHTLHQHLCTQVLWFFESRADWAGALYIKGGWIHWEAPSLMIDSVVMTPLSEPIHIHSLPSSTCQPFFILIQIMLGVPFLNILLRWN